MRRNFLGNDLSSPNSIQNIKRTNKINNEHIKNINNLNIENKINFEYECNNLKTIDYKRRKYISDHVINSCHKYNLTKVLLLNPRPSSSPPPLQLESTLTKRGNYRIRPKKKKITWKTKLVKTIP